MKATSIQGLTLLVVFVLFAAQARAQSCKFTIDKPDPITGERMVAEGIDLGHGTGLGVGKAGSKPEMAFTFNLGGEHNFTVEDSSLCIVKLANGDSIHLHSRNVAPPTTFTLYSNIITRYTLEFNVPADFYARLAEQPAMHFRVHLGSIVRDIPVGKGDGKKIRKYAACLK